MRNGKEIRRVCPQKLMNVILMIFQANVYGIFTVYPVLLKSLNTNSFSVLL